MGLDNLSNFESQIFSDQNISSEIKNIALDYLQKQEKSLNSKEFLLLQQQILSILQIQDLEKEKLLNFFESEKEKILILSVISKNKLRLDSIVESFDFIKQERDENTGVGVAIIDNIVGAFGGDTGTENYERMEQMTKQRLEQYIFDLNNYLLELRENLEKNPLIYDEKMILELENILLSLEKQRGFELGGINFLKSIIVSIKNLPTTAKYASYGVIGVAQGGFELAKGVVMSAFDLTEFIWNYSKSFFTGNEQYRKEIYEQISIIWEVLKEIDSEIVVNVLKQEMDKIAALPSEQQAKAIGQISGNVIGTLASMGALAKIPKVAAKLKTIRNAESISVGTKISIDTARASLFVLGGPAEKVIGKSLSSSYKKLVKILSGNKPAEFKISSLDEVLSKFKTKFSSSVNPDEKKILQEAIDSMELERFNLLSSLENIGLSKKDLDLFKSLNSKQQESIFRELNYRISNLVKNKMGGKEVRALYRELNPSATKQRKFVDIYQDSMKVLNEYQLADDFLAPYRKYASSPADLLKKTVASTAKIGASVSVLGGVGTLAYAKKVGDDIYFEAENQNNVIEENTESGQNYSLETSQSQQGTENIVTENNTQEQTGENGQETLLETIEQQAQDGSHITDIKGEKLELGQENILLNNEIKNIKNLRKLISEEIVQDLEKPTRQELINILSNDALRKQKGIVYNYAIQASLSFLGFGEKMGKIDGFFGKKTIKSIKYFQNEYKDDLDIKSSELGHFGPKTAIKVVNLLETN
ncbi:hypothetical protein DLH72_01745 [Candidatus Gracilibacteria bacterium]|nr:MAG: hypothetical protein DLH72_01745 [Candidatus Gracilibacteria bacterium]